MEYITVCCLFISLLDRLFSSMKLYSLRKIVYNAKLIKAINYLVRRLVIKLFHSLIC